MAEHQSSHDLVYLVAELNARRIAMVLGRLKRRWGDLPLSKEQEGWLFAARRLHQRFKRDIYLHTDEDAARIAALCKWLVSLHCQMERIPDKVLEIDVTKFITRWPLAVGTYSEAIAKCQAME